MQALGLSAIGLGAVLDGENLDAIAVIVEANPVIADAQAKLWRFDILKTFDVASLCRMRIAACWPMARTSALALAVQAILLAIVIGVRRSVPAEAACGPFPRSQP